MQKVEGSSPFSRFGRGPQKRAFCVPAAVQIAGVSRNASRTPPIIGSGRDVDLARDHPHRMSERPIDVLRREVLAVLNRAEQARAWEHRARAAEAALREIQGDAADAGLLDGMAASLRALRARVAESRVQEPGVDPTTIDDLLKRYDAACRKRTRRQ